MTTTRAATRHRNHLTPPPSAVTALARGWHGAAGGARASRRQNVMADEVMTNWRSLGLLGYIALAIVLLNVLPTATVLYRLGRHLRTKSSRSRQSGARETGARLGRGWATLSASSLALSLTLFWASWRGNAASMDCAGPGCAQGLAELRDIYFPYVALCGIPLIGVVGWIILNRVQEQRSAV